MDLVLAPLQPERLDQIKSIADAIDGSPAHGEGAVQPSSGPGTWPLQVSNQQPRQLSDLIQKLHSGYIFLYKVHYFELSFPAVLHTDNESVIYWRMQIVIYLN